jgi:hypothetical protein
MVGGLVGGGVHPWLKKAKEEREREETLTIVK